MSPRGIRLNNPTNMRRTSIVWLGEAKAQLDPDFLAFASPIYGIRAPALDLAHLIERGVNTVRKIVTTWAPPSENDTDAYIRDVADRVGVQPDDLLTASAATLCRLVEAIIWHENGEQPYGSAVIAEGVSLALTRVGAA